MKAIVLDFKDNVATAIVDISTGSLVKVRVGNQERDVKLLQDISKGHKFALARMKKGGYVIKYGEAIGVATNTIAEGEYVHVHNVVSQRGRGGLVKKNEHQGASDSGL